MSKNINARIALKRDTSANWTNYNPILLNGELILVDTAEGQLRAKVGDGTKTYTQLPFSDEALRALITEVDNNNSAVVVTKNGESRLLDTFNIIKLSQEEYDELESNNLLDPDALYLTEGNSELPIQSDWKENDETSLAFIKNKPFYEYGQTIVQLDEKFIPDTIARTSQLEDAGSKVILTDDGIPQELDIFNIVELTQSEYDSLVSSGTVDSDTLYVIEEEDSAIIVHADWENNDSETAGYIQNRPFYENNNGEIVQLDEKFIPNTIARTSQLQEAGSKVILSDLITGAEPENLKTLNIIRLSQEEYDALVEAGTLDPKAIYMTEAASGGNSSEEYLPLTGGTVSGVTTFSNTTASTSTTTGAVKISGGLGVAGNIYATKVYGAVWNDYAEYREGSDCIFPGEVVCEKGDDTLIICNEDCAAGCYVVSDTFGFAIGQTKKANIPVTVSGRVLVYTIEDRMIYKDAIGRPVCGTYGGRIRLMTDEEAAQYPWKILGTVSSVPEYEVWGEKEIEVNNRVWIKVR